MTTKQIFSERRKRIEQDLNALSVKERYYDYLISIDVVEEKAARYAFGWYFEIKDNNEFSPDEAKRIAEFEREYSEVFNLSGGRIS